MYFSDYEERIQQTPSQESGRWNGKRGESKCLPQSDESQKILKEKGIDGINYRDGVPDFSPVSESTIKISQMNSERNSKNVRSGRDDKNTIYYHTADGAISHKASKNSIADISMKYENPGNFEQADILTAQNWSREKRDGKDWSAADVENYRKQKDLTWHECNDGETMQLIPSAINKDFGHLGGTAEMKRKEQIIAEVENDWAEGKVSFSNDSKDETKQGKNSKWDEQKEKWSKGAQKHMAAKSGIHSNNQESEKQEARTKWEEQKGKWNKESQKHLSSRPRNREIDQDKSNVMV